jgi:hypothetical protein
MIVQDKVYKIVIDLAKDVPTVNYTGDRKSQASISILSDSNSMANPQLHPFEINPHTGEPFLRLRNNRNIILTPPRPSDVTPYLSILNDPRVYQWMIGLSIPHLPGISIPVAVDWV